MATLTSNQGFVNDGTGNLTVGGVLATNETVMVPLTTLPGSASFGAPALSVGGQPGMIAIPAPGFYQIAVSGSGGVTRLGGTSGFTGSLPSPAAFPGGDILITDTLGIFPYMITGSIAMMVSSSFNAGGALGAQSSTQGTHLVVSQGGTVGLWSDSKGWLVCAVSGSCTLTA